ncbi:MAG TPA: ATPase, T2SS/T4P/T4SS family, partial [Casimicrobium huifangae]|nr:ATPase, T2SS/T4P/T4SS family [Casimicrobium huifangae]
MATSSASVLLSGLGRALVQHDILRQVDAEQVQTQANATSVTFVEELVTSKRITAGKLAEFAASTFGVPLFDLSAFDTTTINQEWIDVKLITARRALPLHKRGNRLFVALSDPTNLQALEEFRFKTSLIAEPIVVEDDKLGRAIAAVAERNDKTLASLDVGDDIDLDIKVEDGPAAEEDTGDVDDAPVVRYIQKILLDAINSSVSDIHFEPYEKFYRIRYRLDGVLVEVAKPPLVIKDKIASRIKVISKLDISEKRVPQDGRMKLQLTKNRSIDFRVSTLPTLYGEKIVMRILDSSNAMLGIDALGYDADQKAALLEAISRPYGMILVTGPTGSGKTISLYTCLGLLNKPGINISTAEDPAEINLPGVNQVNVNDKAGLTFAAALKSFLRQDPDIIMVGEIRDLETAEIAIK